MATINFNITGSKILQSTDVSAGTPITYSLSNDLSGSSYFTLETVRDNNGFYPLTYTKQTSGSFTLGSGLTGLVQSNYIAAVVVSPGGGDLVFTPAVDVTGSALYLRGTGA